MYCRPTGALDCLTNVVSEQCGEEIAGQLNTLGTKIITDMGCETRQRKRLYFEYNLIYKLAKLCQLMIGYLGYVKCQYKLYFVS